MAERVWVVETGCYEQRNLAGVYRTREAALTAHPVKPTTDGKWHPTNPDDPENCVWMNGLDWDEAAEAWPEDVWE